MKKIGTLISVLVLFTFLMACEPPVVFSSPQPDGVAALSEIPENYRGIYWCGADSINLLVKENAIYKSKLFNVALSKQEVDATEELTYTNGQLIFKSNFESFPATQKNDSVFSTVILKDTIFSTRNGNHILKNFKGHLILNNKMIEDSWEVKIISKSENGYLTLSRVDYPENLTNLDSIASIKYVEDSYREQIIVSPTKAEFGQLLENKIIFGSSCQEFEPVKSNDQNL